MKFIKNIIPVALIAGALFTASCEKEDQVCYPGTIIETDTVFVKGANQTYMTLTGESTGDDRFYAFSGGSDSDLSTLDGENWTYEEWVKVDPAALVGSADSLNGATAGGACIMERGRIFELYLIGDATSDFAVRYNRLDSNNEAVGTMTSAGLSFNEWVHVAISRSAADGVAKFYINGVLVDSSDDALWAQPADSDTWLDFNYMYRGASINFFKGSLDNIRVSYNDRYPSEFTPDQFERFAVDSNTLLQCDLDNNLTPFDPVTDFDKVEIKGVYSYYIKVLNTATWSSEDHILPADS